MRFREGFNLLRAVSQIDHRLRNKFLNEDSHLTLEMDFQGNSATDFPLNMKKTRWVRVQNIYPMRLAALFVTNLTAVHIIADIALPVFFLFQSAEPFSFCVNISVGILFRSLIVEIHDNLIG